MRTRPAAPDDIHAIRTLMQELQPDDPELSDAEFAARFAQILAAPGLHLLVVEDDDAGILGTTYLNILPNLTRGGRPYAVVENVVITEARRGSGLGRQLMAATLEQAWAADCYKVMLMTGSTRDSIHGFYRACGFDGDAKHAYLIRR